MAYQGVSVNVSVMKIKILSLVLLVGCLLGMLAMTSCSEKYLECSLTKSKLEVGETAQIITTKRILKMTTSYTEGTYDKEMLYYVSSDPSVVTVDTQGLVTAVAPGSATIYVNLKSEPEKQVSVYVVVKSTEVVTESSSS